MKKNLRFALAALALPALAVLGGGTAAYAHHAFAAEFDANAPVLLKGKVVVHGQAGGESRFRDGIGF